MGSPSDPGALGAGRAGGGAGATHALGEFLRSGTGRRAERLPPRAAAHSEAPGGPSLESPPRDSPVRAPDGALALGPHSWPRAPPRGHPRGRRIGGFLRLGCTPAPAARELLAAAQGGVRAGGPAGPGRLVGRSCPFLLRSSAATVGSPPARGCVPGPCGTREAPSTFSPGSSVVSVGEALSVKPTSALQVGAGGPPRPPACSSQFSSCRRSPSTWHLAAARPRPGGGSRQTWSGKEREGGRSQTPCPLVLILEAEGDCLRTQDGDARGLRQPPTKVSLPVSLGSGAPKPSARCAPVTRGCLRGPRRASPAAAQPAWPRLSRVTGGPPVVGAPGTRVHPPQDDPFPPLGNGARTGVVICLRRQRGGLACLQGPSQPEAVRKCSPDGMRPLLTEPRGAPRHHAGLSVWTCSRAPRGGGSVRRGSEDGRSVDTLGVTVPGSCFCVRLKIP